MPKLIIYFIGIIGLFFFLVGCGLVYNHVIRARKPVEAEILGSEVESYQQEDEGVVSTLFRSKYQIRYSVDGQTFNSVLRSNVGTSKTSSVEAKLRNNPIGSRRTIFISPNNPKDFVFDPILRRLGFSLVFVSVGLGVTGVAALLLYQTRPLDW